MQACDFSSHLDRTESAGGHHLLHHLHHHHHHHLLHQGHSHLQFGNIMIQEALKISYLDIFSGFHCYKALLVFRTSTNFVCKVCRFVITLGLSLTVVTIGVDLRVSQWMPPWRDRGLNAICLKWRLCIQRGSTRTWISWMRLSRIGLL